MDGASFAALRTASCGPGFATNITIDGEYLPSEAVLTDVGDESIHRREKAGATVSLVRRAQMGSADDPGLTQVLRVRATVDGDKRDLVQCQVFLVMSDTSDHANRALVRLALTTTESLYDQVLPDSKHSWPRSARIIPARKPTPDSSSPRGPHSTSCCNALQSPM